jgi:hypothetical protein
MITSPGGDQQVKGEAYHRLQIWQSHVRTHLLTKEIETAHKVRISTAREETVVAKKEALMQREKAKQKTLNAAFGLVYRALRTYQLHSTAQLIGVWYAAVVNTVPSLPSPLCVINVSPAAQVQA